MPGLKSLEMQQYYAHPQNKFWKILYDVFKEEISADYSDKVQFLERNHLAVWDVIDSCERKGSLDTEIKNEKHHQILQLVEDFPSLKVIFCNGQKSFKTLRQLVPKDLKIPIIVLPSTSPAHTMKYELKLKEWQILKDYF